MHILDGYLDLWIAALAGLASIAVLAMAVHRSGRALDGPRAPLLGVTAAAIFAAQMLNLPIPGGTSVHFVGGAFAAILLGPHLAVLAMTAVVAIQALVFGDGGLIVLGGNVLAMAVVEVYVGYGVYHLLAPYHERGAVFAAGWAGISAAALAVAVMVGASEAFAYELTTVLAIVGGWHVLLGVAEGAITLLAYEFVAETRPDLLADRVPTIDRRRLLRRGTAVVGGLVVLSPAFAWGATQVNYTEPLEHAAETTDATAHAVTTLPGLLPDYGLAGVDPYVGTLVSGFLGAALVLVIGWLAGRPLTPDSDPR
ncbi:nickel transporter [Halorhabdus sp. CBA1104]|nr:nickel transporter [Halorhabdus sp. CBA1104]